MSTVLPVWALVLIAFFVAWPILGWILVRQRRIWVRNTVAVVIMSIGVLGAWVVPADLPWLRFIVLIPFFGAMGKAIEFLSGKLRDPWMLESRGRTIAWLMVIQRIQWPDTPELRSEAQQSCKPVAGRVVGKLLGFLLLLALNSEVSLHHNLWLSCLWMSFVLYFMFSGGLDLFSLPFRMMGLGISEVFNAPPLARNPREFWSRRWNLWFSQITNLLIFQPLGGARRPLPGVSAVFIFSALLHEYMVWVALGAPDGRMTAFFSMHGAATIVSTTLGKRLGRKTLMARPVATLLHFAWFTATAPLFFGPIEEAFNLSVWRLY